jgi:hypothetical protein
MGGYRFSREVRSHPEMTKKMSVNPMRAMSMTIPCGQASPASPYHRSCKGGVKIPEGEIREE